MRIVSKTVTNFVPSEAEFMNVQSLRFLRIILILRVLIIEVFKVYNYNVYITNEFQSLLLKGVGVRVKSVRRGDCKYSKEELLRLLSQLRSRIRLCTRQVVTVPVCCPR